MTILADNVAELLRRAKRQEDVAEAVGVNQSTIGRIAQGSQPKVENLMAIAKYAGVSVEMLVAVPIDQWPRENPDALRRARLKLGWSPAVMAQETHAIIKRERSSVKVTATDITEYEEGAGDRPAKWLQFAQMALQEGGSPRHQDTEPRDDLVYIRQVDIRYAMGAGTAIEDYPSTSLVPFNAQFIRGLTDTPPQRLILAGGQGDSMEPTINEHDLVLIDAGDTRGTLGDTIWAFEYAGAGYIKRLRPVMADGVRLINALSDNAIGGGTFQMLPDELHIVGKVILLLRRKP